MEPRAVAIRVGLLLLLVPGALSRAVPPVATEQARLRPQDVVFGDNFGTAVSLRGDTIAVGCRYDAAVAKHDEGSVYVFVRDGATWPQRAKLYSSDPIRGDLFGTSIALGDGFLAIGAPGRDGLGGINQGAVYIFEKGGAAWQETAVLFAADPSPYDSFGTTVAVSGETLLVGAPSDDGPAGPDQGAVYVFVRTGSSWSQQYKIVASDAAAQDDFGRAIAMSDGNAVIGAPRVDSPSGSNQGAAYVFSRSNSVWSQTVKLAAADPGAGDQFGAAVAIDLGRIVIGAPLDDIAGAFNRGSAYVFEGSGSSWVQRAKFTASDGAAADNFGSSVAIRGAALVVGAPGRDRGTVANAGAAYVRTLSAGGWSEQLLLLALIAWPDGLVGQVAAMDDTTIVLGTFGDAVIDGSNAAFVYRFECLSPGDCANLGACSCDQCVGNVCQHTGAGYGDVDCSGQIEIADVLCVLAGYSDPLQCPEGNLAPDCGAEDPPLIELADVLAILEAYAGHDPCCGS
jgi:hypothetical protein